MHYTTELLKYGNNTGFEVPPEILEQLGGGKRPRVKVSVNDFSFSLTIGSMKGKAMIPVSAERRKQGKLSGGETYTLQLALDTAPQKIDIPDDFAAALENHALRIKFDALAPSHRKEHVRAILDAKKPDTRVRRIDKCIEILRKS